MIVIIGTGLAGYQLAKEIRKRDPQIPITLITKDNGDYYSKPELSTALAKGKNAVSLVTASAVQMALQLKADIITHSAVLSIDTINKKVILKDKALFYEKLVFACGADVIRPVLKGNAASEILSVNHLHHYAIFHESIQTRKKIVILGAGLIGCEFANDLSASGYEVHVIALAKTPLDTLLPPEMGRLLQAALEAQGVRFHFECTAIELNKSLTDPGSLSYEMKLSNGQMLVVETVVSAIGLKPHLDLALSADLKTNRGIVVNHYLETSHPALYALGDCAEVEGRVLPYVAPILHAARALALTLTGDRTAAQYPPMPIVVKTPVFPIVVCPPLLNASGEWVIERDERGARALFYLADKLTLGGFVLTGETIKERGKWIQAFHTPPSSESLP